MLRLSFYPVGTAVELSDGEVGVVVATHADARGLAHPDRPIVHLLRDAEGHPLACPKLIDLLENRDRSIINHHGRHGKKTRREFAS